MQFRDLSAQYRALEHQIDDGIRSVLSTGKFISGPQVGELESRLAAYVGVRNCVTCANGTDALELVLLAWGIGSGDAVFVPSFTFMSTAEVVASVGATPVFVDIEASTFNIDVQELDAAICEIKKEGRLCPKVIIPVDLFGLPADHMRIRDIASRHGLKVLEDAAQGFGGEICERKACSFGDAATTSFFPAKPLGCYGDGGAIFTDDDALATLLRSLCVHGKGAEKYENVRIGRNSRLDTLQAAILLPKLEAFATTELDAINAVARRYTAELSDVVKTPKVAKGFRSSWAQYSVLCADKAERDGLKTFLQQHQIPSMVYYPRPLHLQKAFSYLGKATRSFPVAEACSRTVLALPIHPYLDESQLMQVVDCVKKALKGAQ